MSKNENKLLVLLPLFFILMLDTMGFGLVFPILSPLFLDKAAPILPAGTSEGIRQLWYGITLGGFSVAMFFGSSYLGDISDKIGRKNTLVFSSLLSAVGFLIAALSVKFHWLYALVFSRILGGFTAGNGAVATAAIMDISSEDQKSNNLALMTLANCTGFIIGPIIGGLFSDPSVLPWFNFSLPFYLAAGLSLADMVILGFAFKETFVRDHTHKIEWLKSLKTFVEGFTDNRLQRLSLSMFLYEIGWVLYFFYIALYLVKQFAYSNSQIGVFMAAMGVVWAIVLAVLTRILNKFFALKTNAILAMFLLFLGCYLNYWGSPTMVWFAMIPAAMGGGLGYVSMMPLFSNAVPPNVQGKVMGIAGAMASAAWGVGSVLVSFLGHTHIFVPFAVAGGVSLAGAAVLFVYSKPEHITSQDA